MKNKVIRYDVYATSEKKEDKWMGSYSTLLNRADQPSALEMARMNHKQTQGKIIAVYESGLEEEVLNSKVINK